MKKFILLVPVILLLLHVMYAGDGPNVWTLTYDNNGRVYAMVINPTTPSTIYEAGLDSGIYKTTNGGLNWFPVNTGLTYIKVQSLAISPSNPSVLYAGTDQNGAANSGVYKTTDAGGTWTFVSTGITDPRGIQSIAIHPTNPSIAWLAAFDGINASTVGVFKTTDGGANWFASSTGITNKNILTVAVNPLNGNALFAGSSLILPGSTGPSKIFKSYDGGANWIETSSGLPTNTATGDPVRAMSFSTVDTSVVLAGLFMNDTAGGAYLTTNGGALWVKKHGGLPTVTGTLIRAAIIRTGTTNQFFVGLDGGGATSRGVWRTVNGGNNWVDFSGGAMVNTYTIRSLVFKTAGDSTLYAGAATATSPGKGVFEYSWPAPVSPPDYLYYKFENNPSPTTTPNCANPGVGNNPAAVTAPTVFTTGGQFDTCIAGNGAASGGVVTGWNVNLGTSSWTISMWLQIPSTSSGSAYYIFGDGAQSFRCFHNGVAGQDNIVLRGTGVTDVNVTGVGPGPTVVHFVYDSAASNIKAYKNGVLANTVTQAPLNLSTGTGFKVGGYTTSLTMVGKLDEFRLYKRALSQSEISSTWNVDITCPTIVGVNNGNTGLPLTYSLSQNYPNPFNPTTVIAYELPKAGFVKISVYDVTGREVGLIINEVKSAGKHSAEFNGSGLSSGVYFYKIEAGNFNDTKKMVLVK